LNAFIAFGSAYCAWVCVVARENTLVFFGELVANLLDIFDLAQHRVGTFQNDLARLCHGDETLAVAFKDFNFQLLLEQTDLGADAGLRGVQ